MKNIIKALIIIILIILCYLLSVTNSSKSYWYKKYKIQVLYNTHLDTIYQMGHTKFDIYPNWYLDKNYKIVKLPQKCEIKILETLLPEKNKINLDSLLDICELECHSFTLEIK